MLAGLRRNPQSNLDRILNLTMLAQNVILNRAHLKVKFILPISLGVNEAIMDFPSLFHTKIKHSLRRDTNPYSRFPYIP